MDEGTEAVAEFLAQPLDILDAAVVGDARDDGADAQMLRVVLVGECFDRGSQQLIALCVRGNESAMDHLARPRCAGIQRHFELLTPLPPVDRLCDLEISE